MPTYNGIQKEETLKGLVYNDYFSNFGYEPNIDNIDFVITDKSAAKLRQTRPAYSADLFGDDPGSSNESSASLHYLWAEAKKGTRDMFDMLTQLILTCKKTYQKGEHLAPPWIACFDEARIAFVSFHDMLPIFNETDFNWNTTPSDHETPDFQKAREKVKNLIGAKIAVYTFGMDDGEIKEFIRTHFAPGASTGVKNPITKDNFVQIFIKWVKEVKPFINIARDEWAELKARGILDCDFYRADVMSRDGTTITEKLKIVLGNDKYKFQEYMNGRLFSTDIDFTDGGAAYKRFWNKYGRLPAEEYQQYIIDRRDLLVPQNIREMKGTFFTPAIWANKSKEYLARVFGDSWQEEYYVWDCAAGTGNLLAGLSNEYNVWASDIEQGNVETMQALIDIDDNLNLLSGHVFQFDFLNDSFDKLPAELKKIIDDPEKRKKLIIYINPPYAESGSRSTMTGRGENKSKVATEHKVYTRFASSVGAATRELFAQFFLRIYADIPGAKLASFGKLKYITAENFIKFREYFKADCKAGFICQANTFDNVKGKFPIGFLIWDMDNKQSITQVKTDVFFNDIDLTKSWKDGTKTFFSISKNDLMINWLRNYYDNTSDKIAYLRVNGPDFANNQGVFFTINPSTNDMKKHFLMNITKKNVNEMCLYLAVRHSVEATWLNDRDQFLYPNDGWKSDIEFQNDCLVFALFHGQNRVSANDGGANCANHWIPFTEKEVGAKEKFDSAFMSGFLKEKILSAESGASNEALAVLDAGRELWRYYHAKTKNNRTVSVNASFYDIRDFFQGRRLLQGGDEKGTMNTKSEDETYNALLAILRGKLHALTEKIQPKVYEYGFLKE